MRVLVANIPLPGNRFLVDLHAPLSDMCTLVHDSDVFWEMSGEYDVVHLHFPEYITYGVEDAYRTTLTEKLLNEVSERLRFWADRARIVVTRHVLLPHAALEDPRWARLYETVYSYADGVVHFGQPSVDEFQQRYRATVFARGEPPQHVIIPHQNYASLPAGIDRETARAQLGIPAKAKVVLVFGSIRNAAERELILETFKGLEVTGKVLLASRWLEKPLNISWLRLQRGVRNVARAYYRVHPAYNFNYSFVSEDDTQVYLEASDVLFIPRLRVLNSGNVALGMTFGRVVVGPDSWNVGDLLRSTGNPVFDPEKPETAIEAVANGLRLAAEGSVGPANRKLAITMWNARDCATRYMRFFEKLSRATMTATRSES